MGLKSTSIVTWYTCVGLKSASIVTWYTCVGLKSTSLLTAWSADNGGCVIGEY